MLSLLYMPAGESLLATLSWQLGLGVTGATFIISLAFIVGGCFGSFANACAIRLVRDEDFVFSRSRCRGCDRNLLWWENLPLIGWLAVRGKCGHCGARVGIRYLAVEIFAGALLASYVILLPPALAIGFTLAAGFVVIACLTDFEAMILHPALLSLLGVSGLVLAVAGQAGLFAWHVTSGQALLGLIVSAAFPFAINTAFRKLRGKNGFGEGDFWLMAALGAWLGPVAGVALFIIASWVGAMTGIFLMITRDASIATRLPFGLFAGGVFILWPNLFTRVF